MFRYLLLMGDFIDCVSWYEAKDFGAFAEVVYPFLNVSNGRRLFSIHHTLTYSQYDISLCMFIMNMYFIIYLL